MSYHIFRYGDFEEYFTVLANEDNSEPRCSCCLMEFVALPCCHLLAFLNYFGIQKLPNYLITDRWKRGKKDGIKVDIYADGNIDENVGSYIELSCLTNEIVGIALKTKPLIQIAKSRLEELLDELKEQMSSLNLDNSLNDNVEDCSFSKGKRSITRGSNRLMPDVQIMIPRQAKTKGSGKGGRPKGGGSKRLKSNMEKHKDRKCKCCGKYNVGHDSRNYPSKKEGNNDNIVNRYCSLFFY